MKLGSQLLAWSGVVVCVGTLLVTADAIAFGQQWRPVPGFVAAPAQPYQRVADMRGFRPYAVARTPYQSFDRIRQRPRQPAPASWHAYRPNPAAAAFYPRPQLPPVGSALAAWATPPGYRAPAWPLSAPPFTRQFGWRPSVQPWLAGSPPVMPRLYQYPPAQSQPPMGAEAAGRYSARPAYSRAYAGWRPTAAPRPRYAYPNGYRMPAYTAVPGPAYRSPQPPGWPHPAAQFAAMHPAPVAAARAYWRPHVAAPAPAWGPQTAFRPLAYGRSVAPRDAQGSEFTRERLPGWVTTYREAEYADSCGWCGGS